MGRHLRAWGAKYLFLLGVIVCHVGMWVYNARVVRQDAFTHGEPAPTDRQLWNHYWDKWFENMTSEFVINLLALLVAAWAIQRRLNRSDGGADKGDMRELRAQLTAVQMQLVHLEKTLGGRR